ncbi:phosphotransferase family enzyme [Roseiarcus fermentans]|uniref:Phosphotransferase family enzyme n=1 Tax=Roseiarcus fermentans TaxID=1473586 RepID=A0A366F4X7_9HYPH|nr:phosphotransferase [Roseiarcus fermentans]RBP09702.1 phosphotransferase family enzyme [Roseiarcus fermentans]
MTTEPLPNGITPESLTMALRCAGALTDGRVASVSVKRAWPTILSRIVRLGLAYEGDAADAPASVIVKTGLPERMSKDWSGGRKEIAFYRDVAAATRPGVLPRCFEAEWDEKTYHWRLVLEDLGDSHRIATQWPLPPRWEDCQTILRAWARFHAHWWDDVRLGSSIGRWGDAAAIDQFLRRLGEKVSAFADRMGDRLPSERKRLYERLVDQAPRLLDRFDSRRNVTIAHGDAHVWNCFLPKDGGADVRLFDWDNWRLGIASEDLAYMMAVHWYPDRRQALETRLLDAYFAELAAQGVSGYGRRALADDYRFSVLWSVTTPVWQAEGGIPPVIWWNNYERIWLAFDDLDCRELLG